jgi:hypothetical protein
MNPVTILARWLNQVNADISGRALERVATSRSYGQLFWAMREAGVAIRQSVFTSLNALFNKPSVPDPRSAGHFSPRSVIREAARQGGLHVFPAPELDALQAESIDTNRNQKLLAWLHLYQNSRVPDLCLRYTPHEMALAFQAACCIGWWFRDRPVLDGPGQPGGILLLPDHTHDKHYSPLLHNFAKGLLMLEDACPPELGCYCNRIITMLNTPPDDHPQPTGTQNLYQLQRYTQQQRQSAPPTQRYTTRPLGGGDPWGTE